MSCATDFFRSWQQHLHDRRCQPVDFPMWRIRHPVNPKLYYSHRDGRFVREGYSTWTNRERFANFPNPDPERIWESFGYHIPLYDPGEIDT
jgi:hypothetical protein